MSELREKVKAFVLKNSYFEDANDDDEDDDLRFTTRENGDVGDETPGDEDWQELIRVSRLLKAEFPNQVKCTGETIDEWTDLIVTII
jgi:hypothetical protein